MTHEELVQRVKAVVSEQLGVDPKFLERPLEDVFMGADEVQEPQIALGADSLDAVELVMALEEEFEIDIPDEDVEKNPWRTLADVVQAVAAKVQVDSPAYESGPRKWPPA
mgnify:CR=1 FL=1